MMKKSQTSDKVAFIEEKVVIKKDLNFYYDNLSCLPKDLRNNADIIKKSFNSGIIVLSTCHEKKISVVVAVTDNLLDKFDSTKIIKKLIAFLGGDGGGGRKDLSQGGAPLNENFKKIKDKLEQIIN